MKKSHLYYIGTLFLLQSCLPIHSLNTSYVYSLARQDVSVDRKSVHTVDTLTGEYGKYKVEDWAGFIARSGYAKTPKK